MTWNTSSDWDSATTDDVLHSSDTVTMVYKEDFEDQSSKFQKYIVDIGNAGITSNDPIQGSYSYYVESPNNEPGDFGYIDFEWDNVSIKSDVKVSSSIDVNAIGVATRFEPTGGSRPHLYRWNYSHRNDELKFSVRNSSTSTALYTNSESLSGVYSLRLTTDGDSHVLYSEGSYINLVTDSSLSKEGGVALTAGEVDARYDNIVVRSLDGTVLTANKTFSAATKPDIKNLTYSLNSESITVKVIGSPGTGSEEVQSVSLDGSSSYSLSWSDSHDKFRVKVIMDGTQTSSPEFSKITLDVN